MSYPKIVLLEELTGWNCDSHQESLDRQWEDKLAQLETYVNYSMAGCPGIGLSRPTSECLASAA